MPLSNLALKTEKKSDARVVKLDLTFYFEVVSVGGKPFDGDGETGDKFYQSGAEDGLYWGLPNAVAGGRYVDHDGIDCTRFEVYQPEFEALGDSPESFYAVSLEVLNSSIGLTRAEATTDEPVTVEQLLEDCPVAIIAHFQKHGIELKFKSAAWYKKLESTERGTFSHD